MMTASMKVINSELIRIDSGNENYFLGMNKAGGGRGTVWTGCTSLIDRFLSSGGLATQTMYEIK